MSELNFQSLIEDLKSDPSGALILITGRVGCGKTTMATMIHLEIHQQSRTVVREDSPFREEQSKEDLELSLKTGKVIICSATNEYYFPKYYRDGSITQKVNAKTIRIKFDDNNQGQYSIRIGDGKPYREGHGVVTKNDVENIREITKAIIGDGFKQLFGSSNKEER